MRGVLPNPDRLNRAAVEAIRQAIGVDTLSELSRRSGIEQSFLHRIMSGDRRAKSSHIIAIARALQVQPIAITTGSDVEQSA